MDVTSMGLVAANWTWSKYGDLIVNKATGTVKEKWTKLKWTNAEKSYCDRILDMVSTTSLLGYPKPINVKNIYTDVYVLDSITAKRKFDFEDLNQNLTDFNYGHLHQKRIKATDVVEKSKRVFILGKPGAGKTTFLKYLAILACQGEIHKTPIYVSLKEWSDSGLTLLEYIERLFDICGFPDASSFVSSILTSGEALVLFDGLDEVNHEKSDRNKMIDALSDFAKKYFESTICLTCRVAATDYTFTQFSYVEIADFNEQQQTTFTNNWYQDDKEKLAIFQKEWDKQDSAGYRDLGRTPLLLALLCLAFDETLHFEKRRVDLYKEALDALLKRWDSSRGILRTDVYKKLSVNRKKQLLSRIAAKNFEAGNYLLRKQLLVSEIAIFLSQVPPDDRDENQDPEDILCAIEYQHGLLVERAHGVYSFSHLTFQEYFTASYIVENQSAGTLAKLIDLASVDVRWREVVLMCSSLLDNATLFITLFAEKLWSLVSKHESILNLLSCVEGNQKQLTAFDRIAERERPPSRGKKEKEMILDSRDAAAIADRCLELAAEFSFGKHDPTSPGLVRARQLAVMFSLPSHEHSDIVERFLEKKANTKIFSDYLRRCQLLVECLRISWVDDRLKLTDLVLKKM